MKKQSNTDQIFFSKRIGLLLLTMLSGLALNAQTQHINYSGAYQDIQVPAAAPAQYMVLTATGGDGGKKRAQTPHKNVASGRGAFVQAIFKIGTAGDQIPPGSTVRFIVGGMGWNFENSVTAGAGGGGGTGIAFKAPGVNGKWKLLMVAGGGGGSGSDCCTVFKEGDPGVPYSSGNEGQGFTNRLAGDNAFAAGGSAFLAPSTNENSDSKHDYTANTGWQNGPDSGSPTGAGCSQVGDTHGGWGFGPGGMGESAYPTAGSGGGYTGGTEHWGGNGGTSYVNESMSVVQFVSHDNGKTTSPVDGYAAYEYTDLGTLSKAVHLAKTQTKCFDVQSGNTANGTNIQLYTCNESTSQAWYLEGNALHLVKDYNKCLDLGNSNTANGSNIQLFTCNGTNAQKWIYDGLTKNIRSGINGDKCIDLVNAITTDGNNIQLWDCNDIAAQRWIIDGATVPTISSTHNRIHFGLDTDKCMDVKGAATANGTNVELYHCHTTNNSQYFVFNDDQIQFYQDRTKCLDLSNSKTDNGTNIQLFQCNGTNAQKWI